MKAEAEYKKIFEKIYSDNLHKIRYFIFNFVHDNDIAMSIAHDVFAKVWQNRNNIDFSKDIAPYIIASARNECINYIRKQKNRYKYDEYVKKMSCDLDIDILQNFSSDNIFGNEVRKLLSQALSDMSEPVRTTFLMSRREGLKNREIAEKLDIGLSTVEFRLASASRILRKFLKDYLPFILWVFTTHA